MYVVRIGYHLLLSANALIVLLSRFFGEWVMIRSFHCKETKKIWDGIYTTKFPNQIQERVLRKLRQLDASSSLEDLKNPPGNNLEQLKGDRRGYLSIRVNQQ